MNNDMLTCVSPNYMYYLCKTFQKSDVLENNNKILYICKYLIVCNNIYKYIYANNCFEIELKSDE